MKLLILLGILSVIGITCAATTLKASPPILTATNRTVTLSWSGVTNPTTSDFIGVYSPANTSAVQEYLGWVLLSQSPTYTKGYGEITLANLVNLRADYVFRLFVCVKFPNCEYSDVAISNTVEFEAPLAPSQGHLAFTSDPSILSFMWVSGTNGSVATLKYGLSPDSLTHVVTGNTTTYGINLMCDAPANDTTLFKDPGFIHSVWIGPLQPSTQYFYKFGSDTSGFSDVLFFISPQKQNPDEEVFVVAYGDMGVAAPFQIFNDQQVPALQTAAWVRELVSRPASASPFAHVSKKHVNSAIPPPWSLLHIGDISYARGYAFLWDYFFDLIQPISTQVPYMVCIGNHEFDYDNMPWRANDDYGNDSGGECGVPYNLRFNMPGETLATRNLWYSYNQGPVHFVFMSSEHNFVEGSTQYNWLVNDLALVDRKATPWIVFSGHRPAYTSSVLTSNETYWIREIYEPVWIKYKVNMCLWGHVHTYERTCGVNNYTCVPNDAAPVHVIIGMAGNDFQVPWVAADLDSGVGHMAMPSWSVFRTESYGYTRFYANATHLNFQFVGDQRGDVHDEFWMTPY